MAKVNSKAPRKSSGRRSTTKSISSEGNQALVSAEDWQLREYRHQQRIQDVKICLGFISESIADYNQLLVEQSQWEQWRRYIICDGLPRVEDPPDMRCMIAEMQHAELKDVNASVDWTLSVDERCLLTQNIFRTDLTRKTLEEARPNIGKLYDEDVKRCLLTLDRIRLLLTNDFEMNDMPRNRAMEIVQLRSELNNEINVIFDKLTYRVVCAPNSFRTSFKGVTESYCYKGPNYNFQIWWLSDVPIRFQYLDLPLMLAELDCVGIKLQIPISVLGDNLTLRCVHTFFDHCSETAKSYEQVIDRATNNFNGGMMDIEDCLINEWQMQVNIMNEMISSIEHKLFEYGENLRELELQATAAAKAEKTESTGNAMKKKKKFGGSAFKVKVMKEPEQYPADMFPDPYKTFLEREQNDFEEFLDDQLNPEHMHLTQHEVNLRRYSILGGVYSMFFVRKPKNTNFQKFNMTFHEDGRVLYTLEEVRADVEHNGLNLRSSSHSSVGSMHRPMVVPLQMSHIDVSHLRLEQNELPYFCVTFELPEHLCLFGEPLACQFIEEVEEEDEAPEVITLDIEERRGKKKRVAKITTPKSAHTPTNDDRSVKAKLHKAKVDKARPAQVVRKAGKAADICSELPRPNITTIVPRTLNPRNLYRSSILSIIRLSVVHNPVVADTQLSNFNLIGEPLTNLHNHEMQRHCIPLLLSSFKMPLEFRAERSEEQAERAARGCTLMRRQHCEQKAEEEVDEPEYFNYEKQEGPERLFPVFDVPDAINYNYATSGESSSEVDLKSQIRIEVISDTQIGDALQRSVDKELTMFDLVSTLENIKEQYKARPKKIMDQQQFPMKGSRMRSSVDLHDIVLTGRPRPGLRISLNNSRSLSTQPKITRASHVRSSLLDMHQHNSEVNSETNSLRSSEAVGGSRISKKTSMRDYDHDHDQDQDQDSSRDTQDESSKVKHWTTQYIQNTQFDATNCTFKIQTDRLGIFGFAYKRYEHFPFRNWSLQYNDANNNEIIFTLDTFHVRIFLFITNAGIRGYVTKLTTEYVARPIKYMEIVEPISDYLELRRRFCEKNINIFAEHDACFYIENGYFSEKHLAAELHVYDAFAVHCKLIKFYRSDWNRLATRRNIVLCVRNPKDPNPNADVTVRVTPDNATFVEISEPCSDNLDAIKLEYQPTWRNIGTYSDVHQLINSMYPQATDVRNRDPKLIYYIRKLFTEVRPLSFS